MPSKYNPVREDYLAHIEKQKMSGLSIKKYCEENNLVESKLKYYVRYPLKSKKCQIKSAFSTVKIKPQNNVSTVNKIDPILRLTPCI